MATQSEPRNPFYLLLLIVGMVFIITVLSYAIIPVLEQKALDAGHYVPPREESPGRDFLHHHGFKLVLGEVALLVILGLASMALDRWRRMQQEGANPPAPTTEPTKVEPPPPA